MATAVRLESDVLAEGPPPELVCQEGSPDITDRTWLALPIASLAISPDEFL